MDRILSRVLSRVALLAACALGACTPARPEVREPTPPAATPDVPRPVEAAPAPLRLGALLPAASDADLGPFGELVRQGIEIAVDQDDRSIELVVLDHDGDTDSPAGLVRDLESRGVIGIIGPLLGDALASAAAARTDPLLPIISPTATERPAAPNAYALNAGDMRGAEALAAWLGREGVGPVGTLYARTPQSEAEVQAFAAVLRQLGRDVAVQVPFAEGTTTFAQPLQRLRSAGVRAVYVAAAPRDIRQLAPQFEFYGLGGIQILGNESWAEPDVLRSVQPDHLEGAIVSVPLFRTSNRVAWEEFVGLYEAAYRRTLDSPYPALGYDAARLVLGAATGTSPRLADIARTLAGTEDHRGATGVLDLHEGSVSRRPFLVRIRGGQPVLLPDIER
jgi:ABC-type branched-subunit amino acid transport system substrate-binding protein